MDNETIEKYFANTQQYIQDAVLSPEWKKRFNEIKSKYSLSPLQGGQLFTETLLIITGLEDEADFAKNIEKNVSVSGILAEQLASDVSNRLFSLIIKAQDDVVEKIKTEYEPINEPTSPEIRPEILPVIEKGEKVKVVPPPINLPTEPQTTKQEQKPASFVPSFAAVKQSPIQPTSPVQHPNIPTPTPPIQPPVPPEVKRPEAPKTPEVTQPISVELKKYGIDPYREPLE